MLALVLAQGLVLKLLLVLVSRSAQGAQWQLPYWWQPELPP